MVAGPLTQVLDALEAGAGSLTEVGRRTGLRIDVVRAAADHLVLLGRAQDCPVGAGCPPHGCGDCALADAGRGCAGLTTPRRRR